MSSSADPGARRPALVLPPGGGRAYPMGRISAVFKADGAETANRYSISEWWLEPKTTGPGPHSHEEDDVFYVLEGTMSFLVGERWVEASAGSFVLVPGGRFRMGAVRPGTATRGPRRSCAKARGGLQWCRLPPPWPQFAPAGRTRRSMCTPSEAPTRCGSSWPSPSPAHAASSCATWTTTRRACASCSIAGVSHAPSKP